jgi:hypothetical protein
MACFGSRKARLGPKNSFLRAAADQQLLQNKSGQRELHSFSKALILRPLPTRAEFFLQPAYDADRSVL